MVSSSDLKNLVIGISTAQKFGKKVGIARDILQANHHRIWGGFLKIGANAYVVNAREFTDVVNVVGNVRNGATRGWVGLLPIGERVFALLLD